MNGRDEDRDRGYGADRDCPRDHSKSALAGGALHDATPSRSLSRGPFPAIDLLIVLRGDGGPHDPHGHDGGRHVGSHHVRGGGAPCAPSMLHVS